MSDNLNNQPLQQVNPPCPVTSTEQIPLSDQATPLVSVASTPTIKIPVVVAERTLQIVVEADISLSPAATEIKRVHKNAFLSQVKLVPVEFAPIAGTNFFNVTRAKLFVSGFIRKNIEYASTECNGNLFDRIADVPFSGFADLTAADFILFPILAGSSANSAMFLNEANQVAPRLDKYFFQNLVNYNEQPYGELVRANFFELDFSPTMVEPEQAFSTLREKIVMDLTLKVLQVQQIQVTGNQIIPGSTTGTTLG
ncbi:CsxC family protein [Peribacillus loiseleuriae]|uniref:Uracil permease n=1 Tax=Peribacillus loiseleuriae TaxID=1679170 RepID=A0A0K9GX02_9BACI|nr:hypothetical protein [Peribacillus loiseleuriae]KMY51150.1 Uracil permease [Peribacillus loiseleuriae]